jgi:C-terminal processing protease CtpA/Prc
VDNDGWKAFYAGTGERPLITLDDEDNETWETIGTVLSGLERAAQNPEIRNIIIDISCNGGGDDTALLAIEWLMTGIGYVRDKDSLNSQFNTKYQDFDMNFDGVFDDSDVSPYTDYNYGVLTSKFSFSCGNNFPWFMHEHGAMILGEQSTGGACAIRLSSTGGINLQASSAADCGVNDEGGTIDNGCPVDAELLTEDENPTEGFYDLETLSELMNEFFSEALDQAA